MSFLFNPGEKGNAMKTKTNGKVLGGNRITVPPNGDDVLRVTVPPIQPKTLTLCIGGLTPLISNRKTADMVKKRRAGEALRSKDQEYKDSLYPTSKGYGIKASAFQKAFMRMAMSLHENNKNISKSWATSAAAVLADEVDYVHVVGKPEPYDSLVNIGGKTVEKRRAIFKTWSISLRVRINDVNTVRTEDVINIFRHAGIRVGVGDYRPEKGGTFGTFEVNQITSK